MHIADVHPSLAKAAVIRRLALAAAAALIAATMFLAVGAPAEAHDTCVGHPSDPSFACLKADHSRIDVCDHQSYGHLVWARVHYTNGDIVSFPDTNGANAGCGNWFPSNWSNGYPISYNVCVEGERCGSPRYRPGWGSPTW